MTCRHPGIRPEHFLIKLNKFFEEMRPLEFSSIKGITTPLQCRLKRRRHEVITRPRMGQQREVDPKLKGIDQQGNDPQSQNTLGDR